MPKNRAWQLAHGRSTDKNGPMNTSYRVDGMHCQHCVMHVKQEVAKIPGVTVTGLSLEDGLLSVESLSPVDFADIQAAVQEAGDGDYTVTQLT